MTREEKLEYRYMMKRRMLHEKLLCFILGGVSVAGLVVIIEAAGCLLNGRMQYVEPWQEQNAPHRQMQQPASERGDSKVKPEETSVPKSVVETIDVVVEAPAAIAPVAAVEVPTVKKNEAVKSKNSSGSSSESSRKNTEQPTMPLAVVSPSSTSDKSAGNDSTSKANTAVADTKVSPQTQDSKVAIPGVDEGTAQDLAAAANALREAQKIVAPSKPESSSSSTNEELLAAAAALKDAQNAIQPTETKQSFPEVDNSQAEAEKLAAETRALLAADEAWRAQNAAARAASAAEKENAASEASTAQTSAESAATEQKSYKASTKVDMKNAAPLSQTEVASNAKVAGKCVIACYTADPQMGKSFSYTLFINSSGKVSDYSADSSSMITTHTFESCIEPCLKKISFSPFSGSGSPRVTYSITVSEKKS